MLNAVEQRYRPIPRVSTRLAALGGGAAHALAEQDLKAFLLQWSAFLTLDEAAVKLSGISDAKRRLRQIHHFHESKQTSFVLKCIGAVVGQMGSKLQKALTSDPDFIKTRSLLTKLAENKILLSDEDLISACRSGNNLRPETKIRWLAVCTHNRPESLDRCLRSFLRNFRHFGKHPDILVADDSADESFQNQNVKVLVSVHRDFGIRCIYLGARQKAMFADALHKLGLPLDVIKFAFTGFAAGSGRYGANRNSVLLNCCGENTLMVDDDTACEAFAHPGVQESLTITQDGKYDLWFFKDREESLHFTRRTLIDVLAVHERILGRTLSDAICAFETKPKCEVVCAHLMDSLLRDTGNIALTTQGALGQSGMTSPMTLLATTNPATRTRLVGDIARYKTALRSGELFRSVSEYTVSHRPELMSMFIGLNLRELLPPFVPVGRGEDILFCLMVTKVLRNHYVGHIPWGLLHFGGRLGFCQNHLDEAARIGICEIIGALILPHDLEEALTSMQRIKAIGTYLTAISDQPPAEFHKEIRDRIAEFVRAEISSLESILSAYAGRPVYWANDVRAWLKRRQDALIRPDFTTPYDLDVSDGPDVLRRFVRAYGELLAWWPDLIKVVRAQQLRPGVLVEELS